MEIGYNNDDFVRCIMTTEIKLNNCFMYVNYTTITPKNINPDLFMRFQLHKGKKMFVEMYEFRLLMKPQIDGRINFGYFNLN